MKKRCLCLLLALVCLVTLVAGCGNKSVTLTVSEGFAHSPLLSQLVSAYTQATGVEVEIEALEYADFEKALEKGKFEVLLGANLAVNDRLASTELMGADVFYDTLIFVGPKRDPASVKYLKGYSASDIIKHINMTGFLFVSAPPTSTLGMRAGILKARSAYEFDADLCLCASDQGQALLTMANQQRAYALVSRAAWKEYGAQMTELVSLLDSQEGMTDTFSVVAPFDSKKNKQGQQLCSWLMGQDAINLINQYKEGDEQRFFTLAPTAPPVQPDDSLR